MGPERRNLRRNIFKVAESLGVDFRRAGQKLMDCLQTLDEVAQILNLNLERNLKRVQEQDWFRTPQIVAVMALEEIGLKVDQVGRLSLPEAKLNDLRTLLSRLSTNHPAVLMSLSFTCPPEKYGVDLAWVIREFTAGVR